MSLPPASQNGHRAGIGAWPGQLRRWLGVAGGDRRSQILVIEDGQYIGSLLSSWLERAGYQPLVTSNGLTAYRQFARERPNLLVVDVSHGQIPGPALVRRCKTADSRVPVLAISRGNSHDVVDLIQAGADGVLVKPLSSAEFVSEVERALDQYSQPGPAYQFGLRWPRSVA